MLSCMAAASLLSTLPLSFSFHLSSFFQLCSTSPVFSHPLLPVSRAVISLPTTTCLGEGSSDLLGEAGQSLAIFELHLAGVTALLLLIPC